MHSRTQPGRSFPLGSTGCLDGVNFSVFSKNSTRVELLLFDHAGDAKPATTIALDPRWNRTYHYWHVFVPGIHAGQIYGYRAFGPSEPQRGLRFDPSKLLLDPYGKAMAMPDRYSRINASVPGGNCATAMKSIVADPSVVPHKCLDL